jgi:hypothetical protein
MTRASFDVARVKVPCLRTPARQSSIFAAPERRKSFAFSYSPPYWAREGLHRSILRKSSD